MKKFLLLFSVLSVFSSPAWSKADNEMLQALKGTAVYLELMRTNPDFARVEKTYQETAEKFLSLFDAETQQKVTAFLDAPYQPYWTSSRLVPLADDGSGESFMTNGKQVTTYMNQVIAHRDDPPVLLYLLEAMAGAGSGQSDRLRYLPYTDDDIQQFLDRDALHSYEIHTFPELTFGERGGVGNVVLSETAHVFPTQSWGVIRVKDTSMGLVMRVVKGGEISFSFMKDYAFEEFYPTWWAAQQVTETYREAGETAGADPYEMLSPGIQERQSNVQRCAQARSLRVDTSRLPFVVEAVLEQKYETKEISYYCTPECSIPYLWTGSGYVQGEKKCLPKGKWGASSPFRDGLLIGVEDYYQQVRETDVRLAVHDRRLNDSWKAYYALFAGEGKKFVLDVQRQWLLDRQIPLQPLLGHQDEFVEALVQGDQTVLEYMETVVTLTKVPDARLLFMLDPLHQEMERRAMQTKGIDPGDYAQRNLSDGTSRTGEIVAQMAERLKVFRNGKFETELTQEDSTDCEKEDLSWSGLDGGNSLSYRRETSLCGDTSILETLNYALKKTETGIFWGQGDFNASGCDGVGCGLGDMERRITVIKDGKIHLVTPVFPDMKDFFSKGKAGLAVLKPSEEMQEDGGYLAECAMRPAFDVGSSPPFSVTASLVQINDDSRNEVWKCIAECTLSYRWNEAGMRYERNKPTCLPKGKWGIKRPE